VCCCNARDMAYTALRGKGRYADVSEGKGKGVHEHANEGTLGGAHADPLSPVSPTPRPPYPCRKECEFPIKQRLCGPHSRSASYAKEKNSFHLPGFEPRIVKPAELPQQFASPTTSTRMTPCLATYECAR